ncbi:choice-of-anchor P family protein [Kribbella sp. NPDC048928]|uniref:choice-of-anchor P family protein n=1 Tax=Kribbella sp. NPDC048928 TaxID=3364111 RepID=UPI0037188BBD
MLGQLGRKQAALVTAGALILGSISITGSEAATREKPSVQGRTASATTSIAHDAATTRANSHRRTTAAPAPAKSSSQDRALRKVLAKYLKPGRRDYVGLERDLAALGGTDLTIGGVTPSQAQAAQDSPKSKTAAAPRKLDSGNGKCPPATKDYRFNCELLFFHETSPGYTYMSDVAVLSWDFEFLGEPKPKGEPLDDIAAIDFGNYDEKCYDPGTTSQAAWTYFPGGGTLNGKPAQDVSDLVRRESSSPDNNATVWRVVDEPQDGTNLPKPLVGYVEIDLQHRIGAPGCPTDFEEIRAAGHYLHNEDGKGDWDGVTVGAGYGPLSVSYTPGSKPGVDRQSSTGVLALHEPDVQPTRLNYIGPKNIRYHVPFTAAARLTGGAATAAVRSTAAQTRAGEPTTPIPGAKIQFVLGLGGGTQTCTGTTNANGVASCVLTPTQKSGPTTLTLRYLGNHGTAATSSFVAFTVEHQATDVAYTGPKRVANGTPANLSGALREHHGPAIAGRKLTLSLGNGSQRQSCTGTTDSSGKARCTIASVNQPLNAAATVPVSAAFTGDDFYLSSSKSGTVLLEYYTGRSYGVTGTVGLPLLAEVKVPPSPDTKGVRVAHVFASKTPCTAELGAGSLITTNALCPKVQTSLAPGTATVTSTVDRTTIGIPGLPVIEVRGATAKSTSTCAVGGSATGSTDVAGLYVGGRRIPVSAELNATIDLAGIQLVTNEHLPVPGAEHGLTVNALHVTAMSGNVNLVVASTTSGVHNCAK